MLRVALDIFLGFSYLLVPKTKWTRRSVVARTSVTARADEHRDGEHIESIPHGEKGRQGIQC